MAVVIGLVFVTLLVVGVVGYLIVTAWNWGFGQYDTDDS